MASNLHTCSRCAAARSAGEGALESWWIGPSPEPVAPQHRLAIPREHVPLAAVSAAAWAELATLQREHGLVDRDLTAIDMRQPDRLIVRLTPEAAARRRDPGDAT